MEYYVNEVLYSEHTYEYDNSINYKTNIPVSFKRGAELSKNNVTLTTTRYTDGGIDPFCFSCPVILSYDEQGRVIKATEPNVGWGGSSDPRTQIITYTN